MGGVRWQPRGTEGGAGPRYTEQAGYGLWPFKGVAMGGIVSPKGVEVLSPRLVNVTLLGNRVFADDR